MEPQTPHDSQINSDEQHLTLGERQIKEWYRRPPAAAIRIAVNMLADGFGGMAYHQYGDHPILKVILTDGWDVSRHEDEIRRRLDDIGWQWVTLKTNESGGTTDFGMAPIWFRAPAIAYHSTLKAVIPAILHYGLLPSSKANRQTDFPDTEGRIHVSETLEGEGGAVRWVRLFSERYGRAQSEYAVLQVDLRGVGGRVYKDAHSRHGIVIDRIDRIDPGRILVVDESVYTLEKG
jgi:hypothetical protein